MQQQLQVVRLGTIARPLELQDIVVAQVAPQPLEGRLLAGLPLQHQQVGPTRQVADRHLGLHLVVVAYQQSQQVGEQRMPLGAHDRYPLG
jgi:hypothetical protein